jgi:hypothetical protein
MDHETLISRIEIAAELGVQSQTIAYWERAGWFGPSTTDERPRSIDLIARLTQPNPPLS